jgi:hypothetical protein
LVKLQLQYGTYCGYLVKVYLKVDVTSSVYFGSYVPFSNQISICYVVN